MIEYTNSQIRNVISEYIHNERDRRILERRFVDGLTYERLAEEFDMSVRQIKSIVYRESVRLFQNIR